MLSYIRHALNVLRDQAVTERIADCLSVYYNRERDSSIMANLSEIQAFHRKLEIEDSLKFDAIREDIVRLATDTRRDDEMQAAQLTGLKTKLDMLQREQSTYDRQMKVLKSLYFPDLQRRGRQIREAHEQSNEWIYDPQRTSFMPWLESQSDGDHLFYVIGRVC